jgi:hypothetical protein
VKRNIEGKWVKVKERDDDERNVMKSIVAWRMREPPVAWDEIRNHLRKLDIRTKDNTEWTTERIRRVCKAELRLQLEEQRANR